MGPIRAEVIERALIDPSDGYLRLLRQQLDLCESRSVLPLRHLDGLLKEKGVKPAPALRKGRHHCGGEVMARAVEGMELAREERCEKKNRKTEKKRKAARAVEGMELAREER